MADEKRNSAMPSREWSMSEIDSLIEDTGDAEVHDLVAELAKGHETRAVVEAEEKELADARRAEAEAVVAKAEAEVAAETGTTVFDDLEPAAEETTVEDDVEGVEELVSGEEMTPEDFPEEPEEELPEEAPAEEPAAEPAEEAATPEKVYAPVSDETDYAPGFVDDDDTVDNEPSPSGKPSFMDKIRAFRESFIQVVEGNEPQEEFSDSDYGIGASRNVPSDVQRMTGSKKFMDKDLATQKTKVFDPLGNAEPVPPQVQEVRAKSTQFKGLDENARSPKMIMELADDKPQSPEDKKALAQKTVGIRPIRNANIEHQILTTKVEKATAEFAMEADNELPSAEAGNTAATAPKGTATPTTVASASAAVEAAAAAAVAAFKGEEPEAEPTETVEKRQIAQEAADAVSKTRKFNTADIEPLPTIIAADAEFNTFDKTIMAKGDNKTIEHEETEIDGQIKLNGFDDETMEFTPATVDEDATEEQLLERRRERVKGFRLNREEEEVQAPPKEEPLDYDPANVNEDLRHALGDPHFVEQDSYIGDYVNDEYETAEQDAERLEDTLERRTRFAFVTSIIQAVLTLVALVLTGLLSANGNNLETFGGSAGLTAGINIGILVVVAALSYKTIVKGVLGIVRGRLNASSAVTVVVLANLLADLIFLLVSRSTGVSAALFTAAACFTVLLSNVSRYLSFRRVRDNLRLFTSGIQMYSTEVVANERDAAEITRGMQLENPVIAYNAKVADQAGLMEDSFADDPADYNAHLPTLIVLGVSLLAAIIFGFVRHSAVVGVSLFAALVTIAIPAFTLLASNISLYIDDKRFSRKGSAIVGHRAVEQSAYINMFAIDSTDIFTKDTCHIIGIKTFHNMRIDDAILYAAALVIESKGPLADEFQNVILGKYDLLPSVDGLAYEERLGLSAWIGERRVLFGNRALLTNHNVELPDEDFEKQYTVNGRKVMYLAISGKVAAMFVVKYRPVKQFRRYLQNIDRAGITILVRNTDCNITEEMICKYYRLAPTAVKVLGPVQGDVASKYFNSEKPKSTSGILHSGSVESSMKTLYEARRLYDGVSINNILALAFSVIAAIVGIALAIVGVDALTDSKVLVFQALFTLIGVGLPMLRSRSVGK